MLGRAGVHAARDVPSRPARRASSGAALPVLVREVVEPAWPFFRLGPPTLDGLTRRHGNGLVRLTHVAGEPVVVAMAGNVFAARAASEEAARTGIARMRFATGIDDDLADFHARFREDPLLGPALRARPWLRVRRTPTPFEALAWAVTEQLIELVRAKAIQRRLIAAHGPRHGTLRDAPDAAAVAGLAPAQIDACGLAPKRTLTLRRAARVAANERFRWDDLRPLRAIPGVGRWTIECLALYGLGRLDVVPAGDLGYLKLVGRLTTGNPRAVADEDEVREFFAPYAPYAGMAALHLISGPATTTPALRPAGTRWSAGSPPRAAA